MWSKGQPQQCVQCVEGRRPALQHTCTVNLVNADLLLNADTAALQRDLEQQRLANQGLEAEVVRLTAASAAAAAAEASNPTAEDGGGGSTVELELLRHEVEDLRHDNQEMESGFHAAAAQVSSPFSCQKASVVTRNAGIACRFSIPMACASVTVQEQLAGCNYAGS